MRTGILPFLAGVFLVRNYFNYFTEIEERFQQRRGSLLLLSTLDWALIETWREAGIPLEAALRGIDAAFDKYEERKQRGRAQRINGLAWCAQAVLEASEELKEAAIGTAPAQPVESRESGFEPAPVAAHLERAARILDAASIAPDACKTIAARLRTLAEDAHAAKFIEVEMLEQVLLTLEEKLLAALTAAAPEELLVELKQQAERELAPYRARMGAVQRRQVERQFTQKQLLARYQLPRLSLFYMSQA